MALAQPLAEQRLLLVTKGLDLGGIERTCEVGVEVVRHGQPHGAIGRP